MSKLRILDFDIENRPLAYLGPEYTTGEVTAIAATFIDCPGVYWVDTLSLDPLSYRLMIERFVRLYNEADIVTGHYIREHDLPVVNAACMELGLPPLGDKMTVDTKIDLVSAKYISKSQENLYEMLGLPPEDNKVHISNAMWREMNRLTPQGIEWTRQRVVGDVRMHVRMREELLKRGLLKGPQVWSA